VPDAAGADVPGETAGECPAGMTWKYGRCVGLQDGAGGGGGCAAGPVAGPGALALLAMAVAAWCGMRFRSRVPRRG
jgi:hypothetical protein